MKAKLGGITGQLRFRHRPLIPERVRMARHVVRTMSLPVGLSASRMSSQAVIAIIACAGSCYGDCELTALDTLEKKTSMKRVEGTSVGYGIARGFVLELGNWGI